MEPRRRVKTSSQEQRPAHASTANETVSKTGTPRSSNVASTTSEKTALPDLMRLSEQARRILFLLVLYRLANAFLVTTFFQPDEYFQALEPAWAMVFGKDSGAWLTWVCVLSACRLRRCLR